MAPSRGAEKKYDEGRSIDTTMLTRALTAENNTNNGPQNTNTQATPDRNRLSRPDNLRPGPSRGSSIRIRRLSTNTQQRPQNVASGPEPPSEGTRRRSTSEPRRPDTTLDVPGVDISRQRTATGVMPPLREESLDVPSSTVLPGTSELPPRPEQAQLPLPAPVRTEPQSFRQRRRSIFGKQRNVAPPTAFSTSREYGSNAIDLLDVVDPEVSALSTLTNVQNSLFVPNLGRIINRRPSYDLTPQRTDDTGSETSSQTAVEVPTLNTIPTLSTDEAVEEGTEVGLSESEDARRKRRFSISSQLDESHYAVLPHLFTVDDWDEEEVKALNNHVRHQMHSKRAKFKRQMRGFRKYASKPLGFFVTLYAVLITLFGLIWVLLMIGWLSAGERQPYITHIVDSVLVALFAVVGDGMAPFRAVDTYHMIFIAHYHRLTWRLRQEKSLAPLTNENDLPAQLPKSVEAVEDDKKSTADGNADEDADIEDSSAVPASKERPEYSILTPAQQRKLVYHQTKFAKSHSFYKPHETTTHHAFPLRMLIAAVCLLDGHSLLQIMLGSFTWGWSYHTRPRWITTVILSISITVNISAGVVISIGDRMTRKKEVIERMYRQALTEEAIKKVRKKARRERERQRQQAIGSVRFGSQGDEGGHSRHHHHHHHHLPHHHHGSGDKGRLSLDMLRHHSKGGQSPQSPQSPGGERGRFSFDILRKNSGGQSPQSPQSPGERGGFSLDMVREHSGSQTPQKPPMEQRVTG